MRLTIFTVFLLILFLCIPLANSQGGEAEFNWLSLKEAFKAYADYPSSENALKVIDVLPNSHVHR